jgi:hypothetical protein
MRPRWHQVHWIPAPSYRVTERQHPNLILRERERRERERERERVRVCSREYVKCSTHTKKRKNRYLRKLVLRSSTSTEVQLLNATSLAGGGHIGSGSARRPEKPGQRGCASRVPESQNQPGCGWADASCTGTRKWSQCRQGAAACARYRGPQEAHTYASGPRCAPGRPRGVSAGGLGRGAGLRRRQAPGSHWFDGLHRLRGGHVLCCCGGHSCLHLRHLCRREVRSGQRFDRLHRL